MKIIDIYNKIANGEEVPHFIIDEQEYYVGSDGFLKAFFGEDVEWCVDKDWLNEKVTVIEEDNYKTFTEEIKELDKKYFHKKQRQLANKINEIIRKLNEAQNENNNR